MSVVVRLADRDRDALRDACFTIAWSGIVTQPSPARPPSPLQVLRMVPTGAIPSIYAQATRVLGMRRAALPVILISFARLLARHRGGSI